MPLATLTVMPHSEDTVLNLVARQLERLHAEVIQGVENIAAVRVQMSEQASQMSEQASVIAQIHNEVRFTNGKVKTLREDMDEIVQWRDGVASEDEQAASYAAGRASKEDEYHQRVNFVWGIIMRPTGKVISAALLLVSGFFAQRIGDVVIEVFR
jgi:hypothetical protein